jgi:glycosyltransferase involved in cell wall biosynthesis
MNKLTSLHFIPKKFNYGYINLPLYYSDSKIISHSSCKDFAKIGYVGRISPEKGIEILFESLQLLKSNFQIDSELFVVGKGNWEYIAKLKLFASKLDITVQFIDYNHAPYEFLGSRVDLIVIPSKWEETLGRVAFEASVNGFQVMVSDIGGLPEAASLSGKDFFTFTPGDANDLARKIRSFVSGDKPNRIGMVTPRSMLKQIIASIDSD